MVYSYSPSSVTVNDAPHESLSSGVSGTSVHSPGPRTCRDAVLHDACEHVVAVREHVGA